MRTRKLVAAAAAAGAALVTTALVPATPAAGEDNLSVTVRDVSAQVNRTGGLTVSGTMNCAAAVERAGGVPANTNVMVSVRWTAWQRTARKSLVTATWSGGGYANPCYRSWATDPATDFLPWMTSYYNSSSTPTYVFPTTGRFAKGLVHIDVTVEGGPDTDGPDPDVYPVDPSTGNITGDAVGNVQVWAVTGFDVRAR